VKGPLRLQLLRHEGLKFYPYKDTMGKITIGVGRNLTDEGITREEALELMENDIVRVIKHCQDKLPFFDLLDEVRQDVLLDMTFNMGIYGVLSFKKTLKHIEKKEYALAAKEMLQSKWASQVGERSLRLSRMMATGKREL